MRNAHARIFSIIVAGLLVPACSSDGGGNSGGNGASEPDSSSIFSLPPAPTGLIATPGDSRVTLSWVSVSGASGYNVKSSIVSGGPYALVAVLFPDTTFVDSSVKNGVTYFYVVSAVNNVGEGPDSFEASATPIKQDAGPGSSGGDGDRDDRGGKND